MKKVSVKDLIEFRRRTDSWRRSFVEKIKSNKVDVPTEGGGDYWVSSLSAIANSYRKEDMACIDEKLEELQDKLRAERRGIVRSMYQKNILNLEKYKEMNWGGFSPKEEISFLKKSSENPLLTIKGLQVEAKPSCIYTFRKQGRDNIGAIWFTAKVNGYKIEEVGMFCEILYRFLKHNYEKKFELSHRYCIAVDVVSGNVVDYSEVESASFSKVLMPTLDDINKLM